MSDAVPIVLSAAGRVNVPPATLRALIIANATALSPGLTVLPAGLIDDISGTNTGAMVLIDQAVTETLDSITPYGANAYLLRELGQIYLGQGSTAGAASNTAVYVVFTGSAAGIVISPGFTVSDGTNQYVVVEGGVTRTGLTTLPLFCRAVQPGSWAVPVHSVTTAVTSVPTGYTLTVTNPLAGTPGGAAQTEGAYRAQVLQAGLVASTGMANYLRALLQAVPGVLPQLISIRPGAGVWEIIVGGTGDPYAIGYAIYRALFDVTTLVGSTINTARNVSVTINNYPDSYTVPFVLPPAQTVALVVTWNTSSLNFVSPVGMAQLAQPAIASYINSLPVGAPINLLELSTTFIAAVAGLLPENLLTTLIFSVSIGGTVTPPGTGTQTIIGDLEGYYLAAAPSIVVIQG